MYGLFFQDFPNITLVHEWSLGWCHDPWSTNLNDTNPNNRWFLSMLNWLVVSNILYFQPEPWGNDPIWRAYFSSGLKAPTSHYKDPYFFKKVICLDRFDERATMSPWVVLYDRTKGLFSVNPVCVRDWNFHAIQMARGMCGCSSSPRWWLCALVQPWRPWRLKKKHQRCILKKTCTKGDGFKYLFMFIPTWGKMS